MLKDSYLTEYSKDFTIYEFESIGNKGIIKKRVEYQLINVVGYYNLGFGDVDMVTNEIDDKIVTNNGDREKVTTTVAKTLFTFFQHYPKASVIAIGSTTSRTRLYQMGIANNLQGIKNFFDVYGLKEESWYSFEPNTTYEAFLVRKKIR